MKRYGDILSRKSLPVSVAELFNAEKAISSNLLRVAVERSL